jgi:hypothetical protein
LLKKLRPKKPLLKKLPKTTRQTHKIRLLSILRGPAANAVGPRVV